MYGLDLIKGYIAILAQILKLILVPITRQNTVTSKKTKKVEFGVLILVVKFFT